MIFLDWTAYFGMCHSHHFDTKKLSPWSAIAVTILGRSQILIPNHRPAPMRLLTKTSWPLHSMNPHPCDMILGQDMARLSDPINLLT